MPKTIYGKFSIAFLKSIGMNMTKAARSGCVIPPTEEQIKKKIDPNQAFYEELFEDMEDAFNNYTAHPEMGTDEKDFV